MLQLQKDTAGGGGSTGQNLADAPAIQDGDAHLNNSLAGISLLVAVLRIELT